MTLLELLVVVVIIAILMAISIPGLAKAKRFAEAAKNTANIREVGLATLSWADDNNNRLPSPQYPGGINLPNGADEEEFFPEFWDLGESGLWLDGVVFGAIYLRENKEGERAAYEVTEDGEHLKGTLFESTASVKKNPTEDDWHRHSYAMNANLQYDRIYEEGGSEDAYLTEKTLANLVFRPKAMLYIDCAEKNVVMFEDREFILETLEERWDGTKVIATFLDGHAERLHEGQIPEDDPTIERESSRFWRGVDP